jgi:putative ABC transport system permease protein
MTEWRQAMRLLRRSPAFAAASVLSMALATAACTAVGSFFYLLLLRPLPVPDPGAIVSIYNTSLTKGGFGSLSMPDYRDLAARDDLFETVGAYVRLPLLLDDGARSDRIYAEVPTGNYHGLLRLRPAVGRLLTPEDDRPGAPTVMVVSHRFWEQRFARSPDVIGRVVRINGQPVEIVGVMPDTFRGVLLDWGGAPDVWLPIGHLTRVSPAFARAAVETTRGAPWLQVTARLRANVTLETAAAGLRQQAAVLARDHPVSNGDTTFSIVSTSRARIWPGRRAEAVDLARAVLAAVAILFAVVVLNVGTLQLARLASRRQELSVRLAVGASRSQFVRPLLLENLIVAWAGACLSVPLALGAMRVIAELDLPLFISARSLELRFDWRIFGVVAGVSTAVGLLLGLAQALRAWPLTVRTGMTGGSAPRSKRSLLPSWDLRYTLATLQVAVCLVLAVGAGLLSKSLLGLVRTDLGFNPAHITLFALESYLAPSLEDGGSFELSRRLLARVRQLPGVEVAALAHDVLPTPMRTATEIVARRQHPSVQVGLSVPYNVVTPGYFETLQMPVVAGRAFSDHDSTSSAPVALINAQLAQRLWGTSAQALGQRIRVAAEPGEREIIGVTRNAVYRDVDEAPLPYLFLPDVPAWSGVMTLHVRGERDPDQLIADVRRELRAINPSVSFADVRTLDAHVASRRAGSSLAAYLAIVASGTGLALVVVGLYAVLACLVSQRQRELAIRMAVGASPARVRRFVLAVGLRITTGGLILGGFGALVFSRVIATQLHGVPARDPVVYLCVMALVFVVALGACLVPARHAASLDPWTVLRR